MAETTAKTNRLKTYRMIELVHELALILQDPKYKRLSIKEKQGALKICSNREVIRAKGRYWIAT